MTSADEYRQQIQAGREALRSAIEAAGPRWEVDPDGPSEEERWAPRRVAEHIIGSERTFTGLIAAAMQGKALERKEYSFASPEEALSALDESCADCDRVLRYVEDRDLAKAAAMPDRIPLPKSVEGVLQLNVHHLNDHAQQILSGS